MSADGYPRRQERVSILAVSLFETPLQTDISKIMAAPHAGFYHFRDVLDMHRETMDDNRLESKTLNTKDYLRITHQTSK